jgi:hypothetical protein
MFGPKKDDVSGKLRMLYNEKNYDLMNFAWYRWVGGTKNFMLTYTYVSNTEDKE